MSDYRNPFNRMEMPFGVAAAAIGAGGAIGGALLSSSPEASGISEENANMMQNYSTLAHNNARRRRKKERNFEAELLNLVRPLVSEYQQQQEQAKQLQQQQYDQYQTQFQPIEEQLAADTYGLNWLSPEKQAEYWDKLGEQKKLDLASDFQAQMDELNRQMGTSGRKITWKVLDREGNPMINQQGTVGEEVRGFGSEEQLPYNATPEDVQALREQRTEEMNQGIYDRKLSRANERIQERMLRRKQRKEDKLAKREGRDPIEVSLTEEELADAAAKAERRTTMPSRSLKVNEIGPENTNVSGGAYLDDQMAQLEQDYQQRLEEIDRQAENQKYLGTLRQQTEEAAAGRANADYLNAQQKQLQGLEMAQRRMGADPNSARTMAERYRASDAAQGAGAANNARFGVRNDYSNKLRTAYDAGRGMLQGGASFGNQSLGFGNASMGGLESAYGSSRAGDAATNSWYNTVFSGLSGSTASDNAAFAQNAQVAASNPWPSVVSGASGIIGGALSGYGGGLGGGLSGATSRDLAFDDGWWSNQAAMRGRSY